MALTSSRSTTSIEPVLGHELPKRKATPAVASAERQAPLATDELDPAILHEPPRDAARPEPEIERQAKVHIRADGGVLIDLTDGDSSPTTDMTCPNCGGPLRVDSVDADIRAAHMECLDCQFRFAQRLSLRADDRLESGPTATPKRGRFLRARR